MTSAADTPRDDAIEAALHVIQLLSEARLSTRDRDDLVQVMEPAYRGGDGSARGFIDVLVQLDGSWTEQQREVTQFLEREFHYDARDDRWRIVAAIREAIRARPDQPSVSETEDRQKLLLEAQREAQRWALEAIIDPPPGVGHEQVMRIIRNIK